jgi:hypothetical protein
MHNWADMQLPTFRLPLLLFLSLAAIGQTTGTLRGVVRDPSLRVVPGAKVAVVEQGTNLSRGLNADGEGEFTLPALPVGLP